MDDKKLKGKALNFGGFSGYYGLMSAHDGYGGFNYLSDFEYMNASTWTKPGGRGYQLDWCDTGYQNICDKAKTTSLGWVYEYGLMESASKHSFSLESFMATVSWSDNQNWEVISYSLKHGTLVQKAVMDLTLSYDKTETIKLTGKEAKEFSNIAAVAFSMTSLGSPGNSCTYGTANYGYQLCIAKMKVQFSTKADLKHDNGKLLTPYMQHHQTPAGHVAAAALHNTATAHADGSGHSASQNADAGYHSQLLSLTHDPGLTGQFHLPAIDHLMA